MIIFTSSFSQGFLINSLKESNRKLEESNKNLEFKVYERTREIENKNRELARHRNHLEEMVRQRTFELEIEKKKAEESDKLKSAFLANVSHEIRTPLNAVIGFSELLVGKNCSEKDKDEFKNHILINSESLLLLIDDIIDISRIEANQVSISFSNHNLHHILNELLIIHNRLKIEHGKSSLEIIMDLPNEKDLHVITDRLRLYQILSNLLSNALKFTEYGFIRFGYRLNEEESLLRFFVIDSGLGIPYEYKDFIFDRFRKIEISKTKIFRGAGLGLFITKSLIDMFGGRIWFESEPERGSSFYFEIPYLQPQNQYIQQNQIEKSLKKYNFKGKTFLVAEDEDSSYFYIEQLMKCTGVKVVRARNGKETLKLLKSLEKVDLILMDMQMPELNGYETIKIIKEKGFEIPVIAQSAYALMGQREEILSFGFDDFISKPFHSTDLLTLVKKHLDKRSAYA